MTARIILLALAVAAACTGVAFCGVALFLLLSDTMRAPAAAGLTALVFFAVVGAGVAIYVIAHRPPVLAAANIGAAPNRALNNNDDAVVPALTQLAKDHPFIAMGCAAALGVADAIKKR